MCKERAVVMDELADTVPVPEPVRRHPQPVNSPWMYKATYGKLSNLIMQYKIDSR
jgi:hypothetical protein